MIGQVIGREIKKNRDGSSDKLLLTVEITETDDIQTVELMRQAGEDTNPPDGSKVLILSVGDAWKIAVASDDGIVPSVNPGEKKLYSTNSGAIQAFINLLADGTIEINGSTDFAVRFTALETAFNQLKSDLNSHVHSGVTAGGASTMMPTTPSTADITPAKVEEVKLS